MRITRLFVTGYKNLVDCELEPTALHAITGCNSTGKSNLLEVLPFLVGLHTFDDETREHILSAGMAPQGRWIPQSSAKSFQNSLRIELSCEIQVQNEDWHLTYRLELPRPDFEAEVRPRGAGYIESESISAKAIGARGRAIQLLSRDSEGNTVVTVGHSQRGRRRFKTKRTMSALQALEVREAGEFHESFTVLSSFRNSLLLTSHLSIDPEAFQEMLDNPERKLGFQRSRSGYISSFDPYDLLAELKNNDQMWHEYTSWLNILCNIDYIGLIDGAKVRAGDTKKYIFPGQYGRVIFPHELSTGSSSMLAIVTAIYTFLTKGGVLLVEEPETRIHPAAIIELLRLFRQSAIDRTILFSTHSPIAINSLMPHEVTVMEPVGEGFFTTQPVADLKDAIDALGRGFKSFGDLLQNNFAH